MRGFKDTQTWIMSNNNNKNEMNLLRWLEGNWDGKCGGYKCPCDDTRLAFNVQDPPFFSFNFPASNLSNVCPYVTILC